ncbi:MAG: hypothetical protein PHY14_00465 [Candidatus Gracilibacteria bacterium]|nr:hypothetical protein [Candidatus Gracilibacteria bacterium]
MFNEYAIKARFFPTILSAIPVLLFQYSFLSKELSDFLAFLGKMEIAGNITISIVILYFTSQLNRFISKVFFEKEEIYMPTTDFLLFQNPEYSEEYKKNIYEKLEKDFNIKLPGKSLQEKDILNSRKRIAEVMSLARKRIKDGYLLLGHNIEYGFWRNLSGGSIIAIIFSAITTYLSFYQDKASIFIASLILLGVFLMILLFSRFFIDRIGKIYARVLIQEYMESR